MLVAKDEYLPGNTLGHEIVFSWCFSIERTFPSLAFKKFGFVEQEPQLEVSGRVCCHCSVCLVNCPLKIFYQCCLES